MYSATTSTQMCVTICQRTQHVDKQKTLEWDSYIDNNDL